MVISLRVSVPVLSVHMIETAPSVSTAGKRRMMAFRVGHARNADGQGDGDNGRQPFRNCRHGQADGTQEHVFGGIAAQEHADGKSHGGQGKDCHRQNPAETLKRTQKRRIQRLDLAQHFGDAANLGVEARAVHHTARVALHRGRSGECQRHALGEGGVGRGWCGGLVYGNAFAGEHRLLYAQAARLDDPQVAGDAVAGFDDHHVAGYDVLGLHLHPPAVTQYHRFRRKHFLDAFQRLFGLALLNETDQRVNQYDAEDHTTVHVVLQRQRHDACHQQHDYEHVAELRSQSLPCRATFCLGQEVGAHLPEAFGRFCRTKAGGGAVQSVEGFFRA